MRLRDDSHGFSMRPTVVLRMGAGYKRARDIAVPSSRHPIVCGGVELLLLNFTD